MTAEATVEAAARLRPDAVLLDYWIIGAMDGPDVVRAIRASSPGTVVLVLSWVHGLNQVEASLDAGAAGFLPKSLSADWVVEGIERARAGECPVYEDELRRLIEAIDWHKLEQARDRRRLSRLSAREVEVMTLLAEGHRAKNVATLLYLGTGTVENHVHRILKKLGVASSQEALRIARRCAWAPLQLQTPQRRRPAISNEAQVVPLHVVRPDPPPVPDSAVVVMVADEQRLMAEPLAEALDAFDGIEVVGAYFGDGRAAVQAAIKERPDVLLYDYWMPGTNGPAAARYLGSVAPRTRVLLTSWLNGRAEVEEAADAGAAGFVPKTVALHQLANAIRAVHADRRRGTRRAAARARPVGTTLDRDDWDRLRILTPRELEILHLLCDWPSAKDVAEESGLAEGTIRNYIQSILRKTGANTKSEAVELARRHGLARELGAPPFW